MTRIVAFPLFGLAAFALMAADGPQTPARSPAGVIKPAAGPPAARLHPVRKSQHRRVRKPETSAISNVAAANRKATVEPAASGFVNAAQLYPYGEGVIYQLFAAPERVTDIVLQPGEILGAVASGDTVRWIIGDTASGAGADKRTHILVKPIAPGLRTNLVVTTDRRTYHLALTSTAGAAMSSLSWTYPQDALIALKHVAAEAAAATPVAAGLDIASLRFNYAISGDRPPWRPLRAFDDGRQTFVEFPEDIAVRDAPPLFVVDDAGKAELVNYRMRGRHYVVDRIIESAELRLGTKKPQVVRITRLHAAPAPSKSRRAK